MTRLLLRAEAAVVRVEEAGVFAALVALLVVLTLQVVTRFWLAAPLDWTEELARVVQSWLVFLGAAVGARKAEHFVVEVFMARARFPGKAWVARAIDVVTVGFFLVLAVVSAWTTWFGAIQRMPALDASVAWSYGAIPTGCLLIALHFAMAWLRPIGAGASEASVREAGE